MLLTLTWPDFKAKLNAGLPFRVQNIGGVYYLAAGIDLFELNCTIIQNGGDDQTDYENNYAATAVSYSISPLAPGSYSNLVGNVTSTVKSGPGVLMGIMINDNTTGGTLVIYDNTAGSGTKIATIQIGTPSGGLLSSSGQAGPAGFIALNMKFTLGITAVTTGSTSNNVTIVYR